MADNLLEKASILLTPTAYNDGSMLSVKPENGDGDFTFSRGSAATRVNAQGLVENVQIISSELVSNGNFSQIGTEEVSNGNFSQEGSELITNGDFATDSDWTISGGNAEISNGKLNFNNAASYGTSVLNSASAVSGKTYLVEFTISDYTSGSTQIRLGGQFGTSRNANGTYTEYIVADSTLIRLYPSSDNTTLSIDNISVKEVGQDWTLGSGWSVDQANSKVVGDGTSFTYITQSPISIQNKKVKLTFDISDYVSGTFRLLPSDRQDGLDERFSDNGSYEVVYTSTANLFRFQQQAFNGSISNISVKEVGQDWIFGTGWSIGEDKAVFDTTSNASLLTNLSISSGNLYRLKIEGEVTSGNLKLSGSSGLGNNEVISLPFEQDILHDGGGNTVEIRTIGSAEGFVTNISVKEITDDTDLPRINYEGFSYQDSLGSELIVNGDFATDSNWIKQNGWSIASGSANCNDSTGYRSISQSSLVNTVGKTYKVTYEVSNYVSGVVRCVLGGFALGQATSSNGVVTETITISNASSNTFVYLESKGSGFIGSIDNISVKEYLGQEVVPDSGCGSWLLEPQSTNIYLNSDTLVTQSNATSASTYTVSFYGTGTITFSGTHTGTLVGTGANDRVSATFTATAGTLTSTISGNCEKGQLENLSYATSYIPTNGSIATRLADVATNSGDSTLINSTEGVLYAEIAALADDGTNRTIALNKDINDRIQMYFDTSTNSLSIFYKAQSGATAFIMNQTLTDTTLFNKIAFKWKTNDFSLWINGTKTDTVSSGVTSNADTLNSLDFKMFNNSNPFYGKTKALAVYKEALTDEQLQSLTTI